jgi:signal transduction histidine kinase
MKSGALKNKKFVSISRTLILSVLTTSSMVTSVLTVLQVGLEYRTKSQEMDALLVTMEASLIPTVSERIWNLDADGIKSTMTPILPSMDASSIILKNNEGVVLFEDSLPNFVPVYPIKKVFPITKTDLDGKSVSIGEMELVLFRDKIIKEVRNRFLIVLFLNFIKTAVVATVLLIIFHRKIAGPILEITKYFESHKDLNLVSGSDFNVSARGGTNDELTIMVEHIRFRETKLAEWSQLQREKMAQAESALAEADEAVRQEKVKAEGSARLAQLGEMATSIAHEINNPLAIISGYNFLIRKEANKSERDTQKILSTTASVETTIKRISKIITGLRAYARDGAADAFEDFSVNQIIEDTVAMVETRLKTKGVVLRMTNDSALEASISCRSVQIVQVLVAMINNSFDAICDLPDPWIELDVKDVENGVTLILTDAGPGISKEIEDKIFNPFFSTKPVGQGTGLGLSIAHGIIKEHGGTITVDRSCKNTRFVVVLPRAAGVQKTG